MGDRLELTLRALRVPRKASREGRIFELNQELVGLGKLGL